MRRAVILAMAAAVLTGCGGKGDGKAGGGPAGDEATDGPMRKAGLWTITRIRDGKPPGGATRLCIDAKTDAGLSSLGGGAARSLCSDVKRQHNPDGSWSFSSTCHLGPAGVVSTRGVARGDFSARYQVHSETDTQNAQIASLNGHHVSDLTAAYGGACPPDMQPGDVILPDGMKVNPGKLMAGAHAPGVGGQP